MYKVQLNCHDLQRKIILEPTSYNIVFSIICLKCCLLCSLQWHQMIEHCITVVHNCVSIFAYDLLIYNVILIWNICRYISFAVIFPPQKHEQLTMGRRAGALRNFD